MKIVFFVLVIFALMIFLAIYLHINFKEEYNVKNKIVWMVVEGVIEEIIVYNVNFSTSRGYRFHPNKDMWYSEKHHCWLILGKEIFETKDEAIIKSITTYNNLAEEKLKQAEIYLNYSKDLSGQLK